MNAASYRYPSELPILLITFLLVGGILIIAAGPTLCIGPILAVVFIGAAYYLNKAHHRQLMRESLPVSPERTPELSRLVQDCVNRVRPGTVQFFVVESRQMNAYTFGIEQPNAVVLYSALFDVMDEEELRFIVGHELGHVALGHTWLNTLLGGMAGVPPSFGAAILITFAFRWWNRACEYSADRAGLVASGSLSKSISALVKLVAPDIRSRADFQRALALIDAEDDSVGNVLLESLSTHPMIIRRINQLRRFAQTHPH
jgi:Zn-dependent protease with chaperone function